MSSPNPGIIFWHSDLGRFRRDVARCRPRAARGDDQAATLLVGQSLERTAKQREFVGDDNTHGLPRHCQNFLQVLPNGRSAAIFVLALARSIRDRDDADPSILGTVHVKIPHFALERLKNNYCVFFPLTLPSPHGGEGTEEVISEPFLRFRYLFHTPLALVVTSCEAPGG